MKSKTAFITKTAVGPRAIITAFSVLVLVALLLIVFPVLHTSAAPAEEIQNLCFQTVSGDTVDSESTSLRFLFTVGSLNYTRVGFVFSMFGRKESVQSSHVPVPEWAAHHHRNAVL